MEYDIRHDIATLQLYLAKYGNITLEELLTLIRGKYRFTCPICKGEPFENDCVLCNGVGYTVKKFVPKMIQDGWKIENDSSDILSQYE